MLLVEMMMGSIRIEYCQEQANDKDLRENLDLLEERQERSNICQSTYKGVAEGYYNQRAKDKAFRFGDHVLWKYEVSNAQPCGKLSPKWEGPYKVVEAHRN